MKKLIKNKKFLAASGVAILAASSAAGAFAMNSGLGLKAKLEKSFPDTAISSVDCGAGPGPLCEVVAGKNVFYATKDGKLAVVGSVLDLKAKVDLTDERLRQLAAMQEGEARIGGAAAPSAPRAANPDAVQAGQAAGPKMDLSKLAALPRSNAIVHNAGAAIKMVVFSDFNCGFCQRLANDLRDVKDIEVIEYPVAILGNDSLDKAKLALCSNDRVSAANAILTGGEVKVSGDCSAAEAAVRANTDFFHKNGLQGTPVIIRADGTINEGWMPQADLRAFLGGR